MSDLDQTGSGHHPRLLAAVLGSSETLRGHADGFADQIELSRHQTASPEVVGDAVLNVVSALATAMDYPRVILKPKEEGRLQKGHLWAFSNEVAQAPAGLEPGSLVDLFPSTSQFLARGFYHPHSLIAFRVLSNEQEDINEA